MTLLSQKEKMQFHGHQPQSLHELLEPKFQNWCIHAAFLSQIGAGHLEFPVISLVLKRIVCLIFI